MDLYLLAELKTISLKITTVDMKRPPPDFRSNFEAAQPPILIDNGIAILENEKIERHIMKAIPGGHNLFVADVEVAKKIENLYNKFKVRAKKDCWGVQIAKFKKDLFERIEILTILIFEKKYTLCMNFKLPMM